MNTGPGRLAHAAAAVILAAILTGCTADRHQADIQPASSTALPTVSPAPRPAPVTSSPTGLHDALAQLEGIPQKGRAPKTGYSRDQFGPAWTDVGAPACDTRQRILLRDLVDVVYKDDGRNCTIVSGLLHDPYTGKDIRVERGPRSNAVQIDHVVPLSDAWQKGAQQWTPAQRQAFANDPDNLLAVDGPANEAKGDSDLATWLPPNRSYWCAYTARFIRVKAKYGLRTTPAEHAKAQDILTDCPQN